MPIPVGIMFITRIKVIYAAILFMLMETLFVYLSRGQDSTAHFAHFGGLISGVLLAVVFIKNKQEKEHDPFRIVNPLQHISTNKTDDYPNLHQLAITPQLQDLLKRVEKEDVQQVRQLWLENFIEKTVCPVCKKPLHHFKQRLWCEDNHFRMEY
jgi:hypothetical protein